MKRKTYYYFFIFLIVCVYINQIHNQNILVDILYPILLDLFQSYLFCFRMAQVEFSLSRLAIEYIEQNGKFIDVGFIMFFACTFDLIISLLFFISLLCLKFWIYFTFLKLLIMKYGFLKFIIYYIKIETLFACFFLYIILYLFDKFFESWNKNK